VIQFRECADQLGDIDISIVTDEIEKALKNGNLNTVFSKYCSKQSKALECVEKFENMVDPCLDEEERDFINVIANIAKNLVEFVCHDNGNEMARKQMILNFHHFF
jgi:Protein of unknown function (DUF1397)